MIRNVKFVEPAKVYRMIKRELDEAYFEVMEKGDLIDRGQLRQFEENLNSIQFDKVFDNLHIIR
ncbi:MAG: hypothetical protein C0399_11845 [Syntrophus sp. (in: bacteria)]|nr:hypothetical protein [Syntrophus sp. (in: bacteria)]